MGKTAIDSCARAQAVALYNNSKIPMSMDEMAKQLTISKTCVFNAVKKNKETGKFVDEKRSGRPRRLSEHDQRHLKRLVKDESSLSVRKVTKDLNQSLPEPITSRTVFNYLKRLSYEYKVKLKKQWFTRKHHEQRVTWCQRHAHFS